MVPRVYGRMRVGGNIVWATDFREETETTRQGGGGKGGGGGGGTEVTEYFYFASLAVALCEGPITGLGRIWADGKLMSLDGVTMRVHKGGEDQEPDPFIAAKMTALRLTSTADAGARTVEAVRTDAAAFGLAPGPERASRSPKPVVYGPPSVAILDLPQLRGACPRIGRWSPPTPFPGRAGWRCSESRDDGFELLDHPRPAARIGELVGFLRGAHLALRSRQCAGSRSALRHAGKRHGPDALRRRQRAGGRGAPGVWEIVQAGAAELIAPGRYRLTRLLRGQRGTEGAMGNPAPAGARVVVLDAALASLPIAEADLGIWWNWRIGPAPSGQRRDLSGAGLHARRRRAAAVLGRPCRAAMAQGARARRSTIRWTRRSRALAADSWGALEVPMAEETGGLRGRDPRRRHREADPQYRPRPARSTPPPSRPPTGARRSVPATRSTSASSSSPPSSGGARPRPSRSQF